MAGISFVVPPFPGRVRHLLLYMGWMLVSGSLWAQETPAPKDMRSGMVLGWYQSTQGMGATIWWMKGPLASQRLFTLDVHVLKDPHETLADSYFGDSGSRYIFGKTHHLFSVQPAFGWQKRLVPQASLNSIGIWGSLRAGPAFGVLTPYYVEVFAPNSPTAENNRQIEAYDPLVHTYARIVGRANALSTPFQPSVVLGGAVQGNVLIDLARKDQALSGILLGMAVEGYAQPIRLMARPEEIQAKRWFFTASLGFVFGRRWN